MYTAYFLCLMLIYLFKIITLLPIPQFYGSLSIMHVKNVFAKEIFIVIYHI